MSICPSGAPNSVRDGTQGFASAANYLRGTPQLSNNGTKRHSFPSTFPSRDRRPEQTGPRRSSLPSGSAFPFCAWESPSSPSSPSSPVENRRPDTEKRWTSSQTQKESLNEIPTKDGAKEGSTIAAILDDGAVSRKHEEKEHCEGGVGNSEGDFSFSPFSQTTFAPPQRDGNDKSRPTLSHTFSLPLPRPSASSSDLRTPPSRLFRSLPNVLSTSPAPNSPLTPDFSPVQEEEEEDPARLLPSGESLPPPTSHDPAPASASLRRPFLPGGLEEGQRSDKQEGHQDDAHQKERENPMQTVKETRQEKEKHTKRSYRRGTLSKDRKRTHAASSELNAPRQQLSGHSPSPGLSRSDRYRASSEGDPLSRLAAASMVGDLDRMRNVLCDDPREVNRTAVRGAGRTALHFAAMKGHSQAVALLLDFNACVNSQDRHGNTPLHLAASAGHGEAAFVLLRKRANPELRNKHGSKAAKLATLRGHFAVVSLLRSAGCLSQTRVGPGNRGGGGLRCGARSSASHSSSSFRCSLSDVSFSLSQEGQRLSHLPSASGVSVSSAAGRERAVTESSFVAVEKASSTGNLNEAKGPSRKEDLLFGEAANDSHAKDEQREGRGASREPPNRSIRRAFQHGKMVQRLLGKSKGRGGHDNDMLGGAANDATARTDRQEIERLHELLEEGKEIEEEWRRGSSDRSMTLEEADLKNESKPPQRSERNPGGKSNKVPPPPSPPDHFGLLLDDRLRVVPSKSNSRSALPSHQQTPSAEDACSERTSNGDRQNERKSGGASAAWFVSSRMVSKARQQKTKRANESTESVQNPRGRLQTMGRKVMKSSLVRPTRDETESSVGMDHRGRGEGGEAEFVHMGEEGEEEEQAQVSEQDGQNVIGGDERRNDKNDAMQGRARGAFRKVTQASRLQQPPRKPAAAESLSVQVQNGIGVGDELGQTGPPIDSSGGAPIDLPGELDMEIEGEEEGVGVEGGAKSPPKVLKAKALAKVRAAGALQGKGAGRSEPMIRDLHQTTAVEEEREEDESNGGGVRKPKKFSARAVLQATRLRKGGWGKEGKVDDKGNAVTDAVEEEGAFEIMSEEGKEDAEEVEVPVEDVLRGQGEGKTGTREEDASVSPMREKGHSTQRKAVDRAKVLTRLLKSSALKQPLTGDEKEEQEQHNSSGEEGNGDVIGEAEKDVVEEEKNWKEAGGRRRGVGALYALHRATKTAKLFSQKGSKQDEEESPKETSKENGDSFFVSLSEDGNGKVSSQGNVSLSDAARQAARANRLLSRFAAQRKEGQSGPPPSSDPPEPKNPKESPAAKRRTSFYRRNRGLMHARRLLEPTKEENEKEKNPLQEALSSGWLVSGTREPVGALTAASGGGQKKTENKKRTTGKNSSQWQSTSHEISPSDPANRDIFSTQHSYPVSRTRFQHTLLELRTEDRQASMRLKQDPGSYYRSKTESLNGLLCDFEQMKVVGGMSEHSVENEKERLRAYGKDHTAASLRKTAAQMRSAKNEFPDDPRDSSLGLVGRGVCVPSRNGQREIPLGVKDAFWGPPTEISREQNVQETAHVEEQEGERLQNGQTTKKKTMQLRLPEEEGEGEGDDGGVSKLQPKEDTTRKVTTTEQKTNDPFPSSLLSMKVKRSPSDLKKDAHVHSTPWSHTLPAEDVCTDTLSDIYATLNKLPNPSPHTHKTTCEPIVRPPYQPTQTSSESRENRARELQARLDGSSFSRRLAYGLPEHIQDGDLLPSGESEGEGERIEEEGSFDAGGETGGPREGTFLTVATGQTECIEEGSGISSHVRQKSRRPETHEEDRIEKVPLAALMTENATQEERFVPTAEEAEGRTWTTNSVSISVSASELLPQQSRAKEERGGRTSPLEVSFSE
uniref:Uncharacterized protein n=1 Tax=Chromera velia CCMP2878 TaxID=1169474 RepID=A0A0G4I181_9ALVE|eukprot:Cvel_10080.t1-p1 / transcript=Cvel_10080.t1 / gene=Cvel_10080 / organism=Chromera_velia_CCMP2878 / gene_product=Ankyrin-3, putative / transcript_product=Ankyrin-3, putative / location=Cvel_scaffold600:22498-29009(+) / protein_length=1862 / sequence_SO=supercontig / SO=protein_coding / is_pseudo=false